MSGPLGLVLLLAVPANPVKTAHPHGYERLVKFAPQCASPRPDVDLGSCMTAASMLEQDSKTATKVFIAAWERTAFGRPPRRFDAPLWVSEADLDHNTGKLVPPSDGTSLETVVPAKVTAFEKICVNALQEVYRFDPDEYAEAMSGAAVGISVEDARSLARFSSRHLAASGESGPSRASTVPEDIWVKPPPETPRPSGTDPWDPLAEPAPTPASEAHGAAAQPRSTR